MEPLPLGADAELLDVAGVGEALVDDVAAVPAGVVGLNFAAGCELPQPANGSMAATAAATIDT